MIEKEDNFLIISGGVDSPIDYWTGELCPFFSSSLSSSYTFKALKLSNLRELMSKKFVSKSEVKRGEVNEKVIPIVIPLFDNDFAKVEKMA